MCFFNNILEKLGLKKEQTASAEVNAPAQSAAPKTVAPVAAKAAEKPAMSDKERDDIIKNSLPPKAMDEVDVVKKLEQMASGSGLDWKVSIVDLLKVLGIDSSREARNELAKELGCPEELMSDSAKMNVWLHKTVLKKISQNGGNIPANLLD